MQRPITIGILAHVDAGKTSLTEAILHEAGVIRRRGAVDRGTTVSDWQLDEQQRGITIGLAACTFHHQRRRLTWVDTPGHIDFGAEVRRALSVLDVIVLVISARDGVQTQTELLWREAVHASKPVYIFINKMDVYEGDVGALLGGIEEKLGRPLAPLNWVHAETDGTARTSLLFDPQTPTVAATGMHDKLVDVLSLADDAFMEGALLGELQSSDYWKALAGLMAGRQGSPVLFGAAKTGLGIADLLACIADFDQGAPKLEILDELGAPLSWDAVDLPGVAYVFKTEHSPHYGRRLIYVRVARGRLDGTSLYHASTEATVELDGFAHLLGGELVDTDRLEEGEIGAILLEDDRVLVRPGDLLAMGESRLRFEAPRYPHPVISIRVEAPQAELHEPMIIALEQLVLADDSLTLHRDRSTGTPILSGQGELHLQIAVDRLRRAVSADLRVSEPEVPLRRMVVARSEGRGRSVTPSHSAAIEVTCQLAPRADLEPAIHLEAIDDPTWRSAALSGVQEVFGQIDDQDALVSYDLSVDGCYPEGREIVPYMIRDAVRFACQRALDANHLVEVSPWVRLTIQCNHEHVGRLMTDLARRSARILNSESGGIFSVIEAEVALAATLGYTTDLRSLTAGMAQFSAVAIGYRKRDGQNPLTEHGFTE